MNKLWQQLVLASSLEALWTGFTWPIHLFSLRKYRKGERYFIGPVPIKIREDFTRWNSIRWRWKLWLNYTRMRRAP